MMCETSHSVSVCNVVSEIFDWEMFDWEMFDVRQVDFCNSLANWA